MHPTVADLNEYKSLQPTTYDYVEPDIISVRTAIPKWTWICRVCREVPVGKCVLFPVPDGQDINRFMNMLRSNLASSKSSRKGKYSIRRSKCETYVVVMKAGTWKDMYRRLEQESNF